MILLRLEHRQASGAILGMVLVLLLANSRVPSACAAAIPPPTVNAEQSATTIVFYGQPQVSEDLWPTLFQIVRADLADGTGELSDGLVLDKDAAFVRGSDNLLGTTFSTVISVKLLGRCDVLPQPDRPLQRGPLGWVMQVSGKIQPFVSIDCTRIAQFLRPTVEHLNKEARRDAMDQAIAHVLIYEWRHIATQSSAHSTRGIAQANLSVNELIAGPRSNRFSARNH
jgi:hypothetical protein